MKSNTMSDAVPFPQDIGTGAADGTNTTNDANSGTTGYTSEGVRQESSSNGEEQVESTNLVSSLTVYSTVKQMQGRRTTQEDRFVLIDDLHQFIQELPKDLLGERLHPVIPLEVAPACLFALFDGHMGSLASTFCQKTLPIEIVKELARLPSVVLLDETDTPLDAAEEKDAPRTDVAVAERLLPVDRQDYKKRKLSDGRQAVVDERDTEAGFSETSSCSAPSSECKDEVLPLLRAQSTSRALSSDTGSETVVSAPSTQSPQSPTVRSTADTTPEISVREIEQRKHHASQPQQQRSDPIISLNVNAIAAALRQAFISTDTQFLQKHRLNKDGTTAILTLILGTSMFTAWVGDSRAILGSIRQVNPLQPSDKTQLYQQGVTLPGVMNAKRWSSSELSSDHKPSRVDEQIRIHSEGGIVINVNGVHRVARSDFEEECRKLKQAHSAMGISGQKPPVALAVSRSIGDREFKMPKALISNEPEIRHTVIQREFDRVVVMACDGIFDVMSNQEVVGLIQQEDDLDSLSEKGASELVKGAFQRGSEDNLTVIVIRFI